mgnify:FL=1
MWMLARAVISARSNCEQKPASSTWEGQAIWTFVQALKQESQCQLNAQLGLIDVKVVYLQIIRQILSRDSHSSQAGRLGPVISMLVTRIINI